MSLTGAAHRAPLAVKWPVFVRVDVMASSFVLTGMMSYGSSSGQLLKRKNEGSGVMGGDVDVIPSVGWCRRRSLISIPLYVTRTVRPISPKEQ